MRWAARTVFPAPGMPWSQTPEMLFTPCCPFVCAQNPIAHATFKGCTCDVVVWRGVRLVLSKPFANYKLLGVYGDFLLITRIREASRSNIQASFWATSFKLYLTVLVSCLSIELVPQRTTKPEGTEPTISLQKVQLIWWICTVQCRSTTFWLYLS